MALCVSQAMAMMYTKNATSIACMQMRMALADACSCVRGNG
jgi:hypothetical protein